MTFGIPREAEIAVAGHRAAATAVADVRPPAGPGSPAGGATPAAPPKAPPVARPAAPPAGGSAFDHHDAEAYRPGTPHAQARIDLAAIRANVGRLCDAAGSAEVMAVVKADGYGHGMVAAARAALAGGATWIGVAGMQEALALRAAGVPGRLLAWLLTPGDDWNSAVAAGVELSAGAEWAVRAAVRAAHAVGRPARLHLEAETGLGRGGATAGDWPALVDTAARAEAAGSVHVAGVWSHLARADEPGHPGCDRQVADFRSAAELARRAGLTPKSCTCPTRPPH